MDKQAVLNEIRTHYQTRNRSSESQEGDVTYDDIEADNHIGHSAARRLMGQLVATGLYDRLDGVWLNGKKRVVFRRK